MSMIKSKAEREKASMQGETIIIRCKGSNTDKLCCNNPICKKTGKRLTIIRHNREIHITLFKGQSIEVVCEKCGHKTIITER